MGVAEQSGTRYAAKAARRPVRFWWQPFCILILLGLLWSQLPLSAVLSGARILPPATEARAAYVLLDAGCAAQAFRKSVAVWTSGVGGMKQSQDPDLGGIDLGNATFAPEYLTQGQYYPGSWRPAAVRALPSPPPSVEAPVSASDSGLAAAAPFQGIRFQPDAVLRRAVFAVPAFEETPPERAGHSRFYVETASDGAVEHVLLLTARTPGAAIFERLLQKGRAKGAARGCVDVDWYFAK